MCGIVGYIGNQKACPILINGLARLEYRGYDSAGIAVMEEQEMIVKKDKGRVKNLSRLTGLEKLNGTMGIAHTRWATHGKPSKENSHPHMDNSHLFAVVHNGIIENYQELKSFLQEKGYHFFSATDTEVIPNLIHYFYNQEKQVNQNHFLQAVKKACDTLKGSFAIEVLCKNDPDHMIVVRKDSPLVIGKGENQNYVSSDIPAILSFTKDFYLLEDLEFAYLCRDEIQFYDKELNPIQKKVERIEWNATSAEKDGYEDFMLKEIFEQPNAIRETIGTHLNEEKISFSELPFSKEYLSTITKIYIVACGTAMHAGLGTRNTFEKLCHIPVEVDIASEFRYRDPLVDNKTLCIYISQSGETADTIAALKLAKAKGAKTLAISNVIGSSITREADACLYTHAGPEIAVASTKAYTSQLVLLTILAMYFAQQLETVDATLLQELKVQLLALPKKVEQIQANQQEIKEFAKKVYQEKDMFFLGRGIDYAVALEGSLKLKEISYIHSEAYAAGELKHGPIALIEKEMTVISILTDPKLCAKTISNIEEVMTRGAKTLVITNQEIEKEKFDKVILIPSTNVFLSPILSVIPLQLLAYYISKEKGFDVDKPRNLAKSVTVE